MKIIIVLCLLCAAALNGCAAQSALKSPCAGAPGSPCARTPLPGGPMKLPA